MPLLNPFSPSLPQKIADSLRFGNLHGSALALVVAQCAQQNKAPTIVITPDRLTASRLEQALSFFAPELDLLTFPDWETLPYDNFSPHQDIISERLLTLSRLPNLTQGILITPATTLLQRLPPRNFLDATGFLISKGDKINLDEMRRRLEHAGYRYVSQVAEHGEFAVRGSILDLYPAGSEFPYRIDLFDQDVDSIRTFDPETQRSIDKIEKIDLLPAREFPLTEAAITRFRQNWREQFAGNPIQCPIYQDVSQGFCPAGIEYYLPLFFENTTTLLDYFPSNSLLLRIENVQNSMEQFWTEIQERYEQGRHDITRPLLPPQQLYLFVDELLGRFKTFSQIHLQKEAWAEGAGKFNFDTLPPPNLTINNKSDQPFALLEKFLAESSYANIVFCTESAGRREALLDLLQKIQLHPIAHSTWQELLKQKNPLNIIIAPLDQGICLPSNHLAVIAESQLFGQQIMQQRERKPRTVDSDAIVRNLVELNIGAPVVHIDHGVGRYLGLQTLQMGEQLSEFLTIEYANKNILYVPVSSLHLISRYSGLDPEHAPLHHLGTEQWEKAKRKAAEQVRDVAAELLDVYAQRAARPGHAFLAPDEQYRAFAATFPFEETPDQEKAIENVLQDMQSEKSMDRLICGDVGFGKTEVAMRAAFVAVQNNKQVAILAPTTLLAQQHYQNFKDRFADWPIQIDVISRFRSAQEQKTILDKLQIGAVDILIGTHKLIQKDVKFKNLGLIIIDEEHRFGVQQKEKLKSLRAEVDILTLTATPIPRTLNMALSGLRELSIIATPPARRLSIKTFVREHNNALIREAVMRELLRGGQIYYLHNEVENIEKVGREITTLVPEARIAVAHGQMPERELERVMADFYHRRFNVLLCTTIIESGIDVPTANTIIIDRADKFGLAQLHQLRGRVGRSHHQAYAYLMTPPRKIITSDAVKRLDAISSLEDLGAGFLLATHDLEIRGAGELLGEEQSGNMQAIGFSLYMELLERAVNALKSGHVPSLDLSPSHGTEIDLQIPALIPDDFLPDVHMRLIFYKRIASATDQENLNELQVEMIDRFGLLPETTKNLFRITELKLIAQKLGIQKIDGTATGGRIEFKDKPNIDPARIIALIQKQPNVYKLEGPKRLRFIMAQQAANERIANVTALLASLTQRGQA